MTVLPTWGDLGIAAPAPGDLVTFVVVLAGPREMRTIALTQGGVRKVIPTGFLSWTSAALAAHAEGVHWIRGHHTTESESGVALLAAFALTRGRT